MVLVINLEQEIVQSVNKKKIIIKVLVLLILITVVCLVYFIKTGRHLPDNERFSKEYTKVTENNIFKYATKGEIEAAFNSQNAVIFFGFPSCKWCQAYVEVLNDIAMKNGITEIYYYNIKRDREKNTEFYKEIVSITKEYLSLDEEGNSRIYVPDTYFIKNGEIIGRNDDVEKIEELTELIEQVSVVNCKDNEKGC